MNNKLKILETFDNPDPERDYTIVHTAEEFTSVCPKTGHPDFATMVLEYIPDELCVELKSYKLYLQSFRNDGIYYEAVSNRILNDLVELCKPRYMRLNAHFTGRGGIHSEIEVEYFGDEYLDLDE